MHKLHSKLHRKKQELAETRNNLKKMIKNEHAAIDLASIMVGIIVIGLIGGVIAATVFAVIPWTQDNAAKHQLDSIVQAENAYFGLSAAVPSPLPSGSPTNSFANSSGLHSASLLSPGKTYCAVTTDSGKGYKGFSQSSSGKVWTVSNENSKPEIFKADNHGSFPTDCNFITVGLDNLETPSEPVEDAPYVDPTPTRTVLSYRCDTTKQVIVPISGSGSRTMMWSDGKTSSTRALNAGVDYTVVIEGTYSNFIGSASASYGADCLRSVDHWGSQTGVLNATNAFMGAVNLTNVPVNIPTTIVHTTSMFSGATNINDPDITKWDVSNVTTMTSMFSEASNFNQPLNSWNVSKVADMSWMFSEASNFNQPLNNWNVSKVTDMRWMFSEANEFSQDLSTWDTSSVQSMAMMFDDPFAMKHGVNHNTINKTTTLSYRCDTTKSVTLPTGSTGVITWNDGNTNPTRALNAGVDYIVVVEGTYSKFNGSSSASYGADCLRSVDHWGSQTGVTNATSAFISASNLTNVPANIPTTIVHTTGMFSGATKINDPDIARWDVSNVTTMTSMFNKASSFNQPLNSWNVSNVTDMRWMFSEANEFSQDLSTWDTSSVQSMAMMFDDPFAMKYGVNHNTVNKTTTLSYRCETTKNIILPTGNSGVITWNDANTNHTRTLNAGVDYTVIIEGTYLGFNGSSSASYGADCLRSVDHWGSQTGVTNATSAFIGASNLTNVPANIPTTIVHMTGMFNGATNINDPDIAKWDVSNITTMTSMFNKASSFNQPLNSWNVSKVADMRWMFSEASNFNQPLNNWNVSKVTDMRWMFSEANEFSQDLSSWDTSSVKSMAMMFDDPFAMKHGVNHNTINKTTTLSYRCETTKNIILPTGSSGVITWNDGNTSHTRALNAGVDYTVIIEGTYLGFIGSSSVSYGADCLRSVDHWGSQTGVINASNAFISAINLTNVPANIPTTIVHTTNMFSGATNINDPDIARWDVSNVTHMTSMFGGATSFNQDLSGWNTSKVTSGTTFAPATFPDSFMPAKTSK